MAIATVTEPHASGQETTAGAWLTATRYSLIELARNRFALGLLIVFMPLWYWMFGALIDNTPAVFKYAPTGAMLQVNGHDLTLLTAGLNVITLIVGFLMFAQARGSAAFDRRLTLCGYRQWVLMTARLASMVVVAAVVSLYAALVLMVFWRPASLPLVWVGFFTGALIYGALGLFIGAVVRSEVAGFFLVIMFSLFDTLLQNPLENPLANKPMLRYFPSYGPTQVLVGGGFTHGVALGGVWTALGWFVALAALGLFGFWLRTRAWNGARHIG